METAACNPSLEFDNKPPRKHGLGLITATGDPYRPPNIMESSVLKLLPPLPPPPTPVVMFPTVISRKDPGGIGFIDDIGGGVDGLMSCTESLGFESSDERIADDRQMEVDVRTESPLTRAKWRKDHVGAEKREIKKFPPPLSSFNRNGQPSFFLRSVRTDGRLELTEVRIDRPEILRASREDGRLRLHLIREDEFDGTEHDNEDEQQEENTQHQEELQQEQEEEEEEEEAEEEEERAEEQWKFQVSGEGFRRCTEIMTPRRRPHQNISHHHNLHVWSQHCVPTR